MSIATKLTKLQTDIESAYSEVSSKGGTLPAKKNTENLTSAINSIQSGGGLPTGIKGVWYGSYTPSSDILSSTGFTVTHNLGYVPTVVYCWTDTYIPTGSPLGILAIVYNSKFTSVLTDGGVTNQYGFISFNNASATGGGVLSASTNVGTQTTTTSQIKGTTANRYFREGYKYNILIIAMD